MAETYRVRITAKALTNLEDIFHHIQQHSPQNAATMIERLLDAVDSLATMPNRFRVAGRSRKRGNPVHACVVRPYIIYYRIDEPIQTAFILEIRHGARRQPRRFE
jgi:plasmid stabilization system protein ParE